MALMISHYVQTGIEVKMGTLVKSGCADTPYIWVPCNRAAQCIDKEILITKNGNIDIDIEIDKRMF